MRSGLDPELDGVSKDIRGAVFDEVLKHWNRRMYCQFCRKLEVLVVRGLAGKARMALESILAWTSPVPVQLSDSVFECLPVRVAESLESGGFLTIGSVCAAKDYELLERCANFGPVSLRVVRATCDSVSRGERLERVICSEYPELEPEFEFDWDYFGLFQSGGKKDMDHISESVRALVNLLENPVETERQIAAEIDRLKGEIDVLRRVQRVVMAKGEKNVGVVGGFEEMEKDVVRVLSGGGPMTCKQIGEELGVRFEMIGKCLALSDRFVRNGWLVSLR